MILQASRFVLFRSCFLCVSHQITYRNDLSMSALEAEGNLVHMVSSLTGRGQALLNINEDL